MIQRLTHYSIVFFGLNHTLPVRFDFYIPVARGGTGGRHTSRARLTLETNPTSFFFTPFLCTNSGSTALVITHIPRCFQERLKSAKALLDASSLAFANLSRRLVAKCRKLADAEREVTCSTFVYIFSYIFTVLLTILYDRPAGMRNKKRPKLTTKYCAHRRSPQPSLVL